MRTLTFDFDNIGGIQHVYAIPAEVFQAITINYATLRRALRMLSADDVVKIPVYADESFSFEEPHGRDDHGDYWQPSISGIIPAASFDNAQLIETLERGAVATSGICPRQQIVDAPPGEIGRAHV